MHHPKSLKIYYNKRIKGFTSSNYALIRTILLKLKKKKEDAEVPAESRKLDDRRIRLMNCLRVQSNTDADKYNVKVHDKYLKNMEIDPRTAAYKSVKNVDSDFVTTDKIRAILKQKYRHGGFTKE
jgi:hypothetical protein